MVAKLLPKLEATRCKTCGRVHFPAKQVCPTCYSGEGIEPVELDRYGTTYTFAIQRMMTPKWGSDAVIMAYVDLDKSGIRILGRLQCAPDQARIGMPVEVVVDDRAPDNDGFVFYHFRPIADGSKETHK